MNITEIATAILPSVMEIIGTIAMFMAAKIGIPWLREQRIFSLVRKLVKGAEKAAEAGKIPKTDKHALVVRLLKMKGIEVTPFLDAFIDAAIKEMMAEQSLICYGLRGALQGLIEQGCNGPCKDALEKLNKHLNQEAHHNDL